MTNSKQKNISNGWRLVRIGDVAEINKKALSASTASDYKFKYIDLSSVDHGSVNINGEDYIFATAPSRARRIIERGDVLMATVRPNLLGHCMADFSVKDVVCSTGFAVIQGKENELNNKFIYQYLFSKKLNIELGNMLVGSSYPAINSNEVANLQLLLPPLPEQNRIVAVLETWDKAIEKLAEKIELKKKIKKGLMQRLLSGKLRLSGFKESWQETKLGEFIESVSARNKKLEHKRVLSVTNKNGFVLPEKQFARVVASEDLSNYKIVSMGDYAYNPSRINVGSIARLEEFDKGVLSPMYVVFKTKSTLDSDYLFHWLSTKEANCRIRNCASGSVRESVDFKSFATIKIKLPSLKEQNAISVVLNAADKEIDLLKVRLSLSQAQKKYLLNNLITGTIRVSEKMSEPLICTD